MGPLRHSPPPLPPPTQPPPQPPPPTPIKPEVTSSRFASFPRLRSTMERNSAARNLLSSQAWTDRRTDGSLFETDRESEIQSLCFFLSFFFSLAFSPSLFYSVFSVLFLFFFFFFSTFHINFSRNDDIYIFHV